MSKQRFTIEVDADVLEVAADMGVKPDELMRQWLLTGRVVMQIMRTRGGGVWFREKEGAQLERLVTWKPALVESQE